MTRRVLFEVSLGRLLHHLGNGSAWGLGAVAFVNGWNDDRLWQLLLGLGILSFVQAGYRER